LRVVTTPLEDDIAETDREELTNGYTVPEPQGFEGGKQMASAGKSCLPPCLYTKIKRLSLVGRMMSSRTVG